MNLYNFIIILGILFFCARCGFENCGNFDVVLLWFRGFFLIETLWFLALEISILSFLTFSLEFRLSGHAPRLILHYSTKDTPPNAFNLKKILQRIFMFKLSTYSVLHVQLIGHAPLLILYYSA